MSPPAGSLLLTSLFAAALSASCCTPVVRSSSGVTITRIVIRESFALRREPLPQVIDGSALAAAVPLMERLGVLSIAGLRFTEDATDGVSVRLELATSDGVKTVVLDNHPERRTARFCVRQAANGSSPTFRSSARAAWPRRAS